MSKFTIFRVVAAFALAVLAVCQPVAWADSTTPAANIQTVSASPKEERPPTYVLILAGLSAVAFIAVRRGR